MNTHDWMNATAISDTIDKICVISGTDNVIIPIILDPDDPIRNINKCPAVIPAVNRMVRLIIINYYIRIKGLF